MQENRIRKQKMYPASRRILNSILSGTGTTVALENFQISAAHIRRFLATSDDPEKIARATAQLVETERRINDIKEGIQNFEKWIEEDERTLKGE